MCRSCADRVQISWYQLGWGSRDPGGTRLGGTADPYASASHLACPLPRRADPYASASPWRAYYHAALIDFVHVVPIWRSSRDDVLRLTSWLESHDALAERIARNGQHFACEHLTQPARLCYWRKAIEAYAPFMGYTPSLEDRPRAFPLERLNIMCRIRDAPVVCYYNILARGPPVPQGYRCEKPVPGAPNGSYEECWYRGDEPAAG